MLNPWRTLSLSVVTGRLGDSEHFVNTVVENRSEMWPGVLGHQGAQGDLTDVLRVLHVPNLRHAAARPVEGGRKDERERETEGILERYLQRLVQTADPTIENHNPRALPCAWSRLRTLP